MNREILFRGKRTDNNEWVFGSIVVMDNECKYGNYDVFSNLHIVEKKEIDIRAFSKGCGTWVNNEFIQVHKETIGQLIHIEKGGRKWFEGDIAKIDIHVPSYCTNTEWGSDYEGFDGYAIGEVTFNIRHGLCLKNYKLYTEDSDEFIGQWKFKTITLCRAEIIGNIHENKDLV